MTAYYNEIDPAAAEWLRELIKAGAIADGIVDERDIQDVTPRDLAEFTQCHFFAGIGGWSTALRLSGWSDDTPVWTGSCPCQPFSEAGLGAGFADERHLWPAWNHLISQCLPPIVFGEQVASQPGLAWLDLVSADLEASGYAFGSADLCAAGVGAPHIRQRLWLTGKRVAYATLCRQPGPWLLGRPSDPAAGGNREDDRTVDASGSGGLADTAGEQRDGGGVAGSIGGQEYPDGVLRSGLADADNQGCRSGDQVQPDGQGCDPEHGGGENGSRWAGPSHHAWAAADWLFCRDARWRPVEPDTFPLADGVPSRVGRLRGYGNAIVPQVAAAFIQGVMDHD